MLHVPALEVHALAERDIVSAGDLPQAGETGLAREDDFGGVFHSRALSRDVGPWADEVHFTANDVDQLWELVEAPAAKEATSARDPRVITKLVEDLELRFQYWIVVEDLMQAVLGVQIHAPELEDVERTAVEAQSPLPEEYGPG